MAVEVELCVVDQVESVVPVVLLRDVESRTMPDAEPFAQILESQAEALPVSCWSKPHVSKKAHVSCPLCSWVVGRVAPGERDGPLRCLHDRHINHPPVDLAGTAMGLLERRDNALRRRQFPWVWREH